MQRRQAYYLTHPAFILLVRVTVSFCTSSISAASTLADVFPSPKSKHREGRLCEGDPVDFFILFFLQLSDGRAGLARVFFRAPCPS